MSNHLEEVMKFSHPIKIVKWKVREGTAVAAHQLLMLYENLPQKSPKQLLKYKSTHVGTAKKVCVKDGDTIRPGEVLMILEECKHPTVMKDMCAECGADLRQSESTEVNASVPMVHSIPELKVSEELAMTLGKADEVRLLKDRKLTLLVDLDQTLIHTTNDNIPPNLKDVVHFQLYGPQSPWYHTRIRPGTEKFLEAVSEMYELHICTFGARNYAHYIALFLDPDGRFFSHRILSRDECFDANSKTANLKALFPCGDSMVCIIDDREDVWNYSPNLIHVKPYHFFQHTGDINAPPGLTKKDNDSTEDGFDFTKMGPSKSRDYAESDKKTPAAVATRKKSTPSGETTTDKDTEDEKDARVIKVASRRTSAVKEGYSDVSMLDTTVEDSKMTVITEENSESCTPTKEPEKAEKGEPESHLRMEDGSNANEASKNEEKVKKEQFTNQQTPLTNEAEKAHNGEPKNHLKMDEDGSNATSEATKTGEDEKVEIIEEASLNKTRNPEVAGAVVVQEIKIMDIYDSKECKKTDGSENRKTQSSKENRSSSEEKLIEELKTAEDDTGENFLVDIISESLDKGCEKPQKEIKTISDDVLESTTISSLENVVKSLEKGEAGKPQDTTEEKSLENNGAKSNEVTEKIIKKDEDEMIEVEDSDDYLLYLEDILKKIHKLYYEEYDARQASDPLPDLKVVIPNAKNQVLSGCRLVFSGLVPSHVPLQRSRAYAVAVSLGATVTVEVSSDTTHLVAARAGTAKVNSSRRQKGVQIVTPHWLWHCAERWEKVDERLYPLARGVVTNRHPPAHCGSPQHPTEPQASVRTRTDSGRFSDTINPLLSFSPEDFLSMDKEVEALCGDDTDSEESASEIAIRSPVLPIVEPESSSCDSMTGGSPKGYISDNPKAKAKKRKLDTTTCTESDLEEDSPSAKFRRGEPLPSDLDLGEDVDSMDDSQDLDDSAWNLMGAALEREFLSGD